MFLIQVVTAARALPEKVSARSLEAVGRVLTTLVYHTPIEVIEKAARAKSR